MRGSLEKQPSEQELQDFVSRVWDEGAKHYRDLPWRNIEDPYEVLVSEVMLQQTQVSRVHRYWLRFLELFPSIDALASAEVSLVLEVWQGLGYNRRALALKKTAEICSATNQGELPCELEELQSLPGIGPVTAAGIRIFAHNIPAQYLDTNVRAVFIHEFFSEHDKVKDSHILPLMESTCSHENPRSWYYSLLDYGAHLKMVHPNPSRKSAHYARQSAFEGSRRQKRAEILRLILADPGISFDDLLDELNEHEKGAQRPEVDRHLFTSILDDLRREGFFREESGGFYA